MSRSGRDCDALGIVKPIVCGLSFGGFVAQAYATQYPEHPYSESIRICGVITTVRRSAISWPGDASPEASQTNR